MHEIAQTQQGAGLSGELFQAIGRVYTELARTRLADGDPETVSDPVDAADIIDRLRTPRSE
jgi:hypothetical protein